MILDCLVIQKAMNWVQLRSSQLPRLNMYTSYKIQNDFSCVEIFHYIYSTLKNESAMNYSSILVTLNLFCGLLSTRKLPCYAHMANLE